MRPSLLHAQSGQRSVASIAAIPNAPRPILPALILAAAVLVATGCGGSSSPDPSIGASDAAILSAKLDEIKANVDNGSCLVAADRTDDLISDIENLPSSVNDSVKNALLNGANHLKPLLVNPGKCAGRTATLPTTTAETTTTEPTTTSQTTTTATTTPTQTQTTPTQTQPTTTTPGSPSGGVGPGGL